MYMDKKEISIIHVVNDNGKSDVLCEINNGEKKFNTGGDIAITNDEKGGLVYLTNKYLSKAPAVSGRLIVQRESETLLALTWAIVQTIITSRVSVTGRPKKKVDHYE